MRAPGRVVRRKVADGRAVSSRYEHAWRPRHGQARGPFALEPEIKARELGIATEDGADPHRPCRDVTSAVARANPMHVEEESTSSRSAIDAASAGCESIRDSGQPSRERDAE